MIKILQVLGTRPSGGVGAFLYNYHQYIDKSKLQFDYLMFNDTQNGSYDEKVKILGANVYVLPALKHKRIFKLTKLLDKFFAEHANEYKIVHLHSANLAFLVLRIAKKYGIKVRIIHAHATVYSDKYWWKALRNKILWKFGLKYATDYFACSKPAGEFYYGKEALKSGVIKVVPNAIDLEKYKFDKNIRKKVRAELNIENKFVVGHIGRMSPPKNQIFLLKVFAEVKKKQDNAILIMVGDGPLRKELEKEILKLGLTDSVILVGVRDDVPQLLMAMDVFLLPSLFEGLGIVAIEAQASGLKCIMSDVIPKETNVGGAEYLSLQADYKKWAEYVLKSLEIKCRSDYTATLIKNGYSIKESAIELQKNYAELIKEKI